jgi:hypothetical protein
MSNKNAGIIMKDNDNSVSLTTILLVPNNPLDLIERLHKFIDISHIESKYLLHPDDLIKKRNIHKYMNRKFL